MTAEEQLLASLLAANQELLEAFRVYDDLERLALAEREEREVEERSRVEQRIDRRVCLFAFPQQSLFWMLTCLLQSNSRFNISQRTAQ